MERSRPRGELLINIEGVTGSGVSAAAAALAAANEQEALVPFESGVQDFTPEIPTSSPPPPASEVTEAAYSDAHNRIDSNVTVDFLMSEMQEQVQSSVLDAVPELVSPPVLGYDEGMQTIDNGNLEVKEAEFKHPFPDLGVSVAAENFMVDPSTTTPVLPDAPRANHAARESAAAGDTSLILEEPILPESHEGAHGDS